jgi:threonine/homoserine/homoserine lactone efflux protein
LTAVAGALQLWAVFVVTETALCLTPGPAELFVLSQALARGTASSLWSSAGIVVGNTVYFILSATGLGAILLASYDVFSAIRWIGAAYLVWMGIAAFHRQVARRFGREGWRRGCSGAPPLSKRLGASAFQSEGL